MKFSQRRVMRGLARQSKRAVNAVAGQVAVGALKTLRLLDPDRMGDFAGWVLRVSGRFCANIALAAPTHGGVSKNQQPRSSRFNVWDNLGRVAAEIAHLDRLWDYDQTRQKRGRILDSDDNLVRLCQLRDDGKPALIFAAHLANWELPAIAATAFGLNATVLYRRPNLGAVADAIIKLRAGSMGTLVPPKSIPGHAMRSLETGAHVALLVDQYNVQGVDVTFFGRRTKANPLIARLARHCECPIHGVRVVRHPGHHYLLELTERLEPPRDAEGKPDISGTMQMITNVVEKWVREYPEQWLWVHRRWR